ncbi:unnamed protein product [Victoria cruziana]
MLGGTVFHSPLIRQPRRFRTLTGGAISAQSQAQVRSDSYLLSGGLRKHPHTARQADVSTRRRLWSLFCSFGEKVRSGRPSSRRRHASLDPAVILRSVGHGDGDNLTFFEAVDRLQGRVY